MDQEKNAIKYIENFNIPEGKHFGLVIGSGRCGTKSMQVVLRAQDNTFAYHEQHLCMWNYNNVDFASNLKLIKKYLKKSDIFYPIGFYFLPYVERFIEIYPSIKILCLKRDKRSVIRSFLRKIRTSGRKNRNLFSDYRSYYWKKRKFDADLYYHCFPHFRAPQKEAINMYYDLYYKIAQEFSKKYPQNFKIMWMNDVLNNAEKQKEALSFLGIPKESIIPKLEVRRRS